VCRRPDGLGSVREGSISEPVFEYSVTDESTEPPKYDGYVPDEMDELVECVEGKPYESADPRPERLSGP